MSCIGNRLNQPIGSWEVAEVTNIAYMLYDISCFSQPLCKWDVDMAAFMSRMSYITVF